MRFSRERRGGSEQKKEEMSLEYLTRAYTNFLNSEELKEQLGLGERGSAGSFVSVRYDKTHNRVVFNLDLKRLSVLDLQTLRNFIVSKTPTRTLTFDVRGESDGMWYIERKKRMR